MQMLITLVLLAMAVALVGIAREKDAPTEVRVAAGLLSVSCLCVIGMVWWVGQ